MGVIIVENVYTSEKLKMLVMWKLLCAILVTVLVGTGQESAVTVIGGFTYYGEITDTEDGLLTMNCTGISETMPLIYQPKNGLGGLDLNYRAPWVQAIDPVEIQVGIGTIIQIMPMRS
jgi:hypothetical protein